MNDAIDIWRERLGAKPGTTEETPFGPQALVYKVAGKMFALLMTDRSPLGINLKCDPQQALIIRDTFSAVTPGYHMNKKHWNTIDLEAGLDMELVQSWIDDSYDLVKNKLPKAVQARLSHDGDKE